MVKRRIRSAEVLRLSLVPKGANRLKVILKEDGSFTIDTLVKVSDDGLLYAVAYAPELRDAQGDIASREVVQQMAHSFAENGAQLDLRHNGQPLSKDQASVVETFIVQGGDPRFADLKDTSGNVVDAEGSWAIVAKIKDPKIRKNYESGEWSGVSLDGVAAVEVEKEDDDVTKEELAKALAEEREALVASITKQFEDKKTDQKETAPAGLDVEALVKSLSAAGYKVEKIKKDDDKADDKVFVGDPSNPADVKKHLANLKKMAVLKATDWTSPEAVESLLKALDGATEDASNKSDREVELEKELAEIRKASNQRTAADGQTVTDVVGLSKEESSVFSQGMAYAAQLRKERETAAGQRR